MLALPIGLAALAAFVYLGGALDGSPATSTGSVQIIGSESMRPVVTACAEGFMARNPQADIVVRGGGSGDGIAAVLHGMADIGMTSRDPSPRERDFAHGKGFDLVTSPLARDAIAIIVNRANPIAAIDIAQVRAVFAGRTRTWADLGSGEGEIVGLARAGGSGTAQLFNDRVLGEDSYGPSVRQLATNEAIVAEVAGHRAAVGYTGLGALRGAGDRVKVVPLREEGLSVPVAPTTDTIKASSYPLARTLYLATAGPPSGAARQFAAFCGSAAAQPLLQRAGYVPTGPIAD